MIQLIGEVFQCMGVDRGEEGQPQQFLVRATFSITEAEDI